MAVGGMLDTENGGHHQSPDVHEVYVKMKELPSYTDLSKKVQAIVKQSTWFEKYGLQWTMVFSTIPTMVIGFYLVAQDNLVALALGMFALGCAHMLLSDRVPHLAVHEAMCDSPAINSFLAWFGVEFFALYSIVMGIEAHVKTHHPHTNIIGLGDSSSFKASFLPCYTYMVFAPLLVPIATPIIATGQLIEKKLWKDLLKFLINVFLGVMTNAWLFVYFANFSWPGAFVCMFSSRGLLSIPYIHINIFQHIGLPMYDRDHRPHRVYQMATSVLNLHSNPLLDFCFGPTLVDCHIEHHLFPRLSDGMCRKIKPVVRKFLNDNNLPYQEDSYTNRFRLFIKRYEEFMVNAPPITHFVGLQ